MKFGFRTPSIKKSFKARTTGKLKRKVKKSVNPLYGKKGMGIINNPQKAMYNKIYSKTTVSIVPKNAKRQAHHSCSNNKLKEEKQPISPFRAGLGLYTCGLSLLFTGVRKKKKKK